MYTFRGTIVSNHTSDAPPEEFGVLTLEVRHNDTNEIEFVNIYEGYLMNDAYDLKEGDQVEILLDINKFEREEVISIFKLHKEDSRCFQDVDLPGEIYDEDERYFV